MTHESEFWNRDSPEVLKARLDDILNSGSPSQGDSQINPITQYTSSDGTMLEMEYKEGCVSRATIFYGQNRASEQWPPLMGYSVVAEQEGWQIYENLLMGLSRRLIKPYKIRLADCHVSEFERLTSEAKMNTVMNIKQELHRGKNKGRRLWSAVVQSAMTALGYLPNEPEIISENMPEINEAILQGPSKELHDYIDIVFEECSESRDGEFKFDNREGFYAWTTVKDGMVQSILCTLPVESATSYDILRGYSLELQQSGEYLTTEWLTPVTDEYSSVGLSGFQLRASGSLNENLAEELMWKFYECDLVEE